MKLLFSCLTAFVLSVLVLCWASLIIGGYVFDHVASYGGPTPMALDTAICIATIAVSVMIVAHCGMPVKDE